MMRGRMYEKRFAMRGCVMRGYAMRGYVMRGYMMRGYIRRRLTDARGGECGTPGARCITTDKG